MKDRTAEFQFLPKLIGIHQVAVMRKRYMSFHMVHYNRLSVQAAVGTGGAVAHMAYRHIPLAQFFQYRLRKNIVYQTYIFIRLKDAVIVHHNAAALLPPVLQSKQPIISRSRHIHFMRGKNPENAAFFS